MGKCGKQMSVTESQLTRVAGRSVAVAVPNRRWAGVFAVALSCLILSGCGGDGDKSRPAADRPACPANDDALPGMRTGQTPWLPELDHLGERLDQIGLPRLTQEGVALDLHVHLSVEVEGTKVKIPSSIGLNGEEIAGGKMASGFVSAIHTHDDSGLVHVHSPDVRPYTLGQLFDVWGVTLTEERIGGYCVGGERKLTVETNGEAVPGDARELQLQDGQRIGVTYGDE